MVLQYHNAEPTPPMKMRARQTALWTGFIYMWSLVLTCSLMTKYRPTSTAIVWIATIGILVAPFLLCTWFAWRFGEEHRQAFFITGIPATLGLLVSYFLMSFIPYLVVPRGTMVHIIGPPHPFDVFGQLRSILPAAAWTVTFPILGRICAEILQRFRSRPEKESAS